MTLVVSRAQPLARRGKLMVASQGRLLQPILVRRIPSALLALRHI